MDTQRLKTLFSAEFPQFQSMHVSKLGEGWDSTAFLVGDEVVFRLPKHAHAAEQMLKEIKILQMLRGRVQAGIPTVEWIGQASGTLLVSAIGYRKLEGVPFSQLPNRISASLYPQIARFLTDLHAVSRHVTTAQAIPWFQWTGSHRSWGREGWHTGLQDFMARIRANVLPQVTKTAQKTVLQAFDAFWAQLQQSQFEPVLIHGDFAPEHVLINQQHEVIGVIDFGDAGLGDAAYDVWPELMPYYGGSMDETFVIRQQFYRRLAPFHTVIYGQIQDDAELVTRGLQQIEKSFAG